MTQIVFLAQTNAAATPFPISYFVAGIVVGIILTIVGKKLYSRM